MFGLFKYFVSVVLVVHAGPDGHAVSGQHAVLANAFATIVGDSTTAGIIRNAYGPERSSRNRRKKRTYYKIFHHVQRQPIALREGISSDGERGWGGKVDKM